MVRVWCKCEPRCSLKQETEGHTNGCSCKEVETNHAIRTVDVRSSTQPYEVAQRFKTHIDASHSTYYYLCKPPPPPPNHGRGHPSEPESNAA